MNYPGGKSQCSKTAPFLDKGAIIISEAKQAGSSSGLFSYAIHNILFFTSTTLHKHGAHPEHHSRYLFIQSIIFS